MLSKARSGKTHPPKKGMCQVQQLELLGERQSAVGVYFCIIKTAAVGRTVRINSATATVSYLQLRANVYRGRCLSCVVSALMQNARRRSDTDCCWAGLSPSSGTNTTRPQSAYSLLAIRIVMSSWPVLLALVIIDKILFYNVN